jgi:hypothetical protein
VFQFVKGLFFKHRLNDPDYTIQIIHHFGVPKAQNSVAFGLQEGGALEVVSFLFQMLATIKFDDEFFLETTKSAM